MIEEDGIAADEGGSGVEWLDEEYVFVRRVNGGGSCRFWRAGGVW